MKLHALKLLLAQEVFGVTLCRFNQHRRKISPNCLLDPNSLAIQNGHEMKQVHPPTTTELENPQTTIFRLIRQQIEGVEVDFLVIMIEQIANSIARCSTRVFRYRFWRCVFLEKFRLQAISRISCAFGVSSRHNGS